LRRRSLRSPHKDIRRGVTGLAGHAAPNSSARAEAPRLGPTGQRSRGASMKKFVLLVALMMCPGAVRAAPGELVSVSLSAPPKTVGVKAGGLIPCRLAYRVIPGRIVSGLKVEAGGPAVSCVAVVDTPPTENGARVFGAGAISAFLKAEKEGTVTVKITPEVE